MSAQKSFPWLATTRVICVMAAAWLQACTTTGTYSAKPISGTLVESETGRPLAGVNVVARWMLEEKTSGVGVGDLDLMETASDDNGTYHFPAWEGKAPPRGKEPRTERSFVEYETRLSSGSPELIFFKPGYRPLTRLNEVYLTPAARDRHHAWQRSSEWDGKVIKLEKSDANHESYANAVAGLMSHVGRGIDCPWKKTPRMYASLTQERERLDKLGIRNHLPSLASMQQLFDMQKCGSAAQFFQPYMQ